VVALPSTGAIARAELRMAYSGAGPLAAHLLLRCELGDGRAGDGGAALLGASLRWWATEGLGPSRCPPCALPDIGPKAESGPAIASSLKRLGIAGRARQHCARRRDWLRS
jgi:hypothetical protein